ncbi:MAG TPA: alpha/beta hydrolase [Pirellulales bacterium]|nr:alpha/beta hydrolase [Pirellulales bacterium]
MKRIFLVLLGLLLTATQQAPAQTVIPLYQGAAPGSENWTHEEQDYFSPIFNTQVVTNVVKPTLTVYAPTTKEEGNGTAVIICPGGGFHALSINSEGVDVARWLNERGVTGLVLKYRLVPTGKDGVVEMIGKNRDKVQEDMRSHFPLAAADGIAAVKYVRDHAEELHVNPKRIGVMGFSAGGSVTSFVALNYTAESRPDFVAPIYAYLGVIGEAPVPQDAPPLFALAASNDPLGLADDSVELYSKWLAAKKSAELHMYAKGGHGFGMKTQKLPSDHWIETFGAWLDGQGLLKK